MALNDTSQLAVKGTVGAQTHVHTLHFAHIGPNATEDVLINEWQASARTAYRNMFGDADSPCQLYTARQVCGAVPLRAPFEESEVAPNIVGGVPFSGDRGPTWLAAVASVRTASAGRSRRGRFFIGGLYESEIAFNNITAAMKTRLEAYITALLGAFGPSGTSGQYRLAVYSSVLAGPGVPCANSHTLVTGILARDAVGSMKSRKPGSGT